MRCPNCGASLDVDDHATSVTCQYCGTSSRVQPRSRIFQVPRPLPPETGAPRPVARQQVNRSLVLLPLVMTVGIGGLVAFTTMRAIKQVPIPGLGGIGGARGADTWSTAVPLVVDVDGDGHDDLVGLTRNVLDGDRAQLAAFRGSDGRALWTGARIGTYSDTIQAVVFAAGGLVVLATPSGELKAFDRATGAPRWTVPLGERVEQVCDDGEAGALQLGTADERWHRVNVADGSRVERKPPVVLDRHGRDKRLQPLAWVNAELPPGVCLPLPTSATEVPGLATADFWSRLPPVEGLNVRRMARRGAGPVVVVGQKQPGTPVPTMAVVDGKAVRWKAVIPEVDPLNARFDDKHLTVGDDAAFAVYEGKDGPRLTGFALADGRRLWDRALTKRSSLVVTGVVMVDGKVVVSAWGNLQAFDAATGAPAYMVGAP